MRPQRFFRSTSAIAAVGVLGLLAGCGQSDGRSAAPTTASDAGGSVAADTPTSSAADASQATQASSAPSTASTGENAAGTPEECSTDGAATTLDPLATEVVPVAVDAASASNALPDVTLRRINCNPGFVNLKNELPADTPVLFWFWAPF